MDHIFQRRVPLPAPVPASVERAQRQHRPVLRDQAPTPSGGHRQVAANLRVRAYAPADAVATYEVFRAAVRRTALAAYTPAQVRAWAPDEVDMDQWAARRAAAWTIVAVHGGHVVGFADLTDAGVMDMIFVHPDHARAGIAATLVARVVDRATRRGLERIEVHARSCSRC